MSEKNRDTAEICYYAIPDVYAKDEIYKLNQE